MIMVNLFHRIVTGMLEICRESNYDTYGEVLTVNKLERTIGAVLIVTGKQIGRAHV